MHRLRFFILLFAVSSLLFPFPSEAFADTGDVASTVEINDSTANGPVLDNDDKFGRSVADIGDLDGDGVSDIAVGAHGDIGNGIGDSGAVHIMFMNSNGTPKSTVEINDSTANGPVLSNWDQFGRSVANIGDLDGDGVSDIAVGAWGDDDGGGQSGALHIMFMNTDGSVDSTVEINSSTANGPVLSNTHNFGGSVTNIGDLDGDGVNDIAVGALGDDDDGLNRGALHIMFMVGSPSTSTTTSGGGGKSNCDSNGFGKNNSLRVYQVSYDIDTYQVLVNAYSTCGPIVAKMSTPEGRSILSLSMDQPLLDDRIVVYSVYLDESDDKFNILIQNKRDSFTETFYIHDKSIIKQYTGVTGYSSEQQGTPLPTVTSTQTTIASEPSAEETVLVENEKQIVDKETVLVENEKQIVDKETVLVENEKQIVDKEPPIGYTPELTEVQTIEEGGGCLIATATYGSEMALEVQQLRELRDNSLLQTESGTIFMGMFNDVYYSFSPIIADYERENPVFKEAVKLAITPMISSLSILNHVDMDSEIEVLGYGASLIILNAMMYVGIPILAIMRIRK